MIKSVCYFFICIIPCLILLAGYFSPWFTSTQAETPSFSYNFSHSGILEEAESPEKSSSPYWWLNSGGQMIIFDGRGSTLVGDIASSKKWNILYRKTNPEDTDMGLHPQNIFRLLTRQKWDESEESARVQIKKIYESESKNRNESNGILLLSRYQNADNLYYAGIRVDGNAAIKKKKNGNYTLLGIVPLFSASSSYNRKTHSNFLPLRKWVGIKILTHTVEQGVEIKLFVDKDDNGTWKEVLTVIDHNDPILEAGVGGIRSDFMEVEFDNFIVQDLSHSQ